MANARQAANKPKIEELDNEEERRKCKAIEESKVLGKVYKPITVCPRCNTPKNAFYAGGACIFCGHAL